MTQVLKSVVALTAFCRFLAPLFAARASTGNGDKPNVLFIVIDDLRPSLGCYGGPIISPNIDQLAAQSALFTNAMVQQSLCAPSRSSFLTGRRPDTTKVYDFGSYWRDVAGNYTTIPQHFKENGYFAASVGKVFHQGVPSGGNDDYPYSWSIPAYHPSTELYNKSKVCPNLDGTLHNNVMCPVDVDKMPEKSLPDIQAFDRAAEILRNIAATRESQSVNKAKPPDPTAANRNSNFDDGRDVSRAMSTPFFLGVGFRKPHVPWKYPKEFQALYPIDSVEIATNPYIPEEMPSVAWDDFHALRLRDDLKALHLSFPFGTIPLDYHAPMRQNYYAAASYTDYQVGRLLSVLEESGFANNTIIVFVGDHGWQLGEHGEWCKFSNFELATRVPLLLHVPGLTDKSWSSASKFSLKDPLQEVARRKTSSQSKERSHKKDSTPVQSKNQIIMSDLKEKHANNHYFHYDVLGDEAFLERTAQDHGNTESQTDGLRIDEFVELVDLFPTLSELADLEIPPVCPPRPFGVDFCDEGVSFAPLLTIASRDGNGTSRLGDLVDHPLSVTRWKNATFSQYPRPSVTPNKMTDVPHLLNITIMGYSMRTSEYHYTEWIGFNHTTFEGNWTDVKARELYLNNIDPDQNYNVAQETKFQTLVQDLSHRLQRGWRDCLPVFGDS